MSHLRGRIRQPFRGYDVARNVKTHFRASRKKGKAETILHHLTFSPVLSGLGQPPLSDAWTLDSSSSYATVKAYLGVWARVSATSKSASGPPGSYLGSGLTASCISPTRHVPRSWLKLTSPPTPPFRVTRPLLFVKTQLRLPLQRSLSDPRLHKTTLFPSSQPPRTTQQSPPLFPAFSHQPVSALKRQRSSRELTVFI